MTLLSSINNPFEFPRQQADNKIGPAIMQFTASQQLLNPNQGNGNSVTAQRGISSSVSPRIGGIQKATMTSALRRSPFTYFSYGLFSCRTFITRSLRLNSASSTAKFVCWKCGSDAVKKPEIICSSCQVIQPIHHGLSYFDYFNIKNDFVIDQNELKKKFREIQTAVHPDKYGLHDENVKKMADDHSSFANHAYKTLSDTRQRALYMLENSNVGESSPDPELAMQMMELNEEIEENNDLDELQKKLNDVEEHINDIVHTMSSHFEEGKTDEAKKDLDKLRYFDRTKKLILKKLQ